MYMPNTESQYMYIYNIYVVKGGGCGKFVYESKYALKNVLFNVYLLYASEMKNG